VPPAGLPPLEQRHVRLDRDGLEEGGRAAGRGERVPGQRDRVASHVGQHAPALLHGVPEPGRVRAGVLFGCACQRERPHALHHGSELLEGCAHAVHVDLVLEVRRGRADLSRQLEHAPRLGEVARQGLLADQAAQVRALLHRKGGLFERGDPGEVRTEEREHVHVGRHLAHTPVYDSVPQPLLAHGGGVRLGGRARRQPGHLDPADLRECAQLEAGDEAAADDAVAQGQAISRGSLSRRTGRRRARAAAATAARTRSTA
jgi:hypothetical protein